ncbi:hypothetical protein B4U80_13659 [Leptotrombidium deliense]|uniref:C-type lectin domain-containing protein n=1 Tax=Leptotrombidium deliense TaxID=299467 RepID=A0A443SNR2_9ACAR|nr:hypothetical protein B4U80_13659 [Leptotrombidium deliense]
MYSTRTSSSFLLLLVTFVQLFAAIEENEISAKIIETIAEWNKECKERHDAPNLKCDNEKVYLIDTTARDFDSARDYCRTLQSPVKADLVSFNSCSEYNKVVDFLKNDRLLKIETIKEAKSPIIFWTSGFSTIEMVPNTNSAQLVHKWLPNRYMDKKLVDSCLKDSDRGIVMIFVKLHVNIDQIV